VKDSRNRSLLEFHNTVLVFQELAWADGQVKPLVVVDVERFRTPEISHLGLP
jgi:hypothetical protein